MASRGSPARASALWNVEEIFRDKALSDDGKPLPVHCLRWSESKQFLASGHSDGEIQLRLPDGLCTTTLSSGSRPGPVSSMRWLMEDDKELLVADTPWGRVNVFHPENGRSPVDIIDLPDEGSVALDVDCGQKCLAAIGKSRVAHIIDIATMQPMAQLDFAKHRSLEPSMSLTAGHSIRVSAVKWHPTHRDLLITGSWDNTIQVWDTRKKESIKVFYGMNAGPDCLDAVDTPTGVWIVVGTNTALSKHPIRVWDLSMDKILHEVHWPDCRISSVSCMPIVGQQVVFATGSDGSRIWDLGTRKEVWRCAENTPAWCGATTQSVVCRGSANEIVGFDVNSGASLRQNVRHETRTMSRNTRASPIGLACLALAPTELAASESESESSDR
mmetsp:Transcript_27143/g.65278  ORF Transcript_27143/g.65278 Transcript_27143/m.65278 type:complete len:386 (-) Transcript_27143:212-1369(-)